MWKVLIFLYATDVVFGVREKNFINLGGFMCPREEKALAHCLKDVLNTYIPQLTTGLPEYNIPPCEPLLIPTLSVQQSAGPISVTSSFTDVTVTGPSTMKVMNVKVDSSKHKVVAKLFIPELKMKGKYNINGNLLMLPIEGNGMFSAKYSQIDTEVSIILGRIARPNHVDALACKHLDVRFKVNQATMNLENLFGGDNDLGNSMNQFLNDNWRTLAEEFEVPLKQALRDFLKPLADHAFATLDADDVLSS